MSKSFKIYLKNVEKPMLMEKKEELKKKMMYLNEEEKRSFAR